MLEVTTNHQTTKPPDHNLPLHHLLAVHYIETGRESADVGAVRIADSLNGEDALGGAGFRGGDAFNGGDHSAETAYYAGIGVLAVPVEVPKSYWSVGTPAAAGRGVCGTPQAYAPLLGWRDDGEVLLQDPLIVVCHPLVHGFGHVAGAYGFAVCIIHAHVKLADAYQFAGCCHELEHLLDVFLAVVEGVVIH